MPLVVVSSHESKVALLLNVDILGMISLDPQINDLESNIPPKGERRKTCLPFVLTHRRQIAESAREVR